MLILDQVNAFYWPDILESEELRVFKQVCHALSRLEMSIFAGKSPLYLSQTSHREYLGDSWGRLVKYRVPSQGHSEFKLSGLHKIICMAKTVLQLCRGHS